MIQHTVLIKFKKDTPAEEIKGIFADLQKLKKIIPGMKNFHGGKDVSIENAARGYTHGFIIEFEDSTSRNAYVPHPEHVKLAQRICSACENGMDDVLVIDIECAEKNTCCCT